jgi:anaerobic magnesium-protoporphyrin IX monomethyl ester cyclase
VKVLLTHSYFLRFDPKQLKAGMPYPPLGTLFAAAVLRERGHEVRVHDIQLAAGPEEVLTTLQNFKPDVFVIYDDGFNYLTKMCLTNMREAAWKMQNWAKGLGCKVVVSSSDSTDHAEKYLEHGADVVIIGEAETTLSELLEAWQKDADIGVIKGTARIVAGAVVKSPKRDVLKDLDQLPEPAWDMLDIAPYRTMWMERHGYFSINMVTTRGCPYKCNWCAKPIYGNRYNSHSARRVVKQLKALQQKFQFTHVWFADDIFGLKPGWLNAFRQEVEREKLKIKYKIQSRADLLLEENNIQDLAASGCEEVWMGAESGSQKILDAMDKGTRVEQIAEASALLKRNGIRPAFFLQFGYPGETLQDIRATIDMVHQLLPADIGVSVSYPLPGTPFYERVKEELKQKSNWTDSDELALMFKNEYPPQFYKLLHRYVHHSYRKRQYAQGEMRKSAMKRVLGETYHGYKSQALRKQLARIVPAAYEWI